MADKKVDLDEISIDPESAEMVRIWKIQMRALHDQFNISTTIEEEVVVNDEGQLCFRLHGVLTGQSSISYNIPAGKWGRKQ